MPIEVEEADVVEAEELEEFVEVALRGRQGFACFGRGRDGVVVTEIAPEKSKLQLCVPWVTERCYGSSD